jgi:hypothetical protein
VLKLLLISILLATFFLPAYAAEAKDPRRGLWSLVGTVFLVELGYAIFLYLVYPVLV